VQEFVPPRHSPSRLKAPDRGRSRAAGGPGRAAGSGRSGSAAVLFSFTSTCQRLGVEPWAYLQDVLMRLPTTPAGQLGDLLPDRRQAARQAKVARPPAATKTSTPSAESCS